MPMGNKRSFNIIHLFHIYFVTKVVEKQLIGCCLSKATAPNNSNEWHFSELRDLISDR